jgi:hypothetical protein
MQTETAEPLLKITVAAPKAGLTVLALRRLIRNRLCASVKVGHTRRVRLSAVRAAIREVPAVP